MLTDRQKQMIEAYLPSPRDKSLMRMCEYYAQDVNGKVHKVFVCEINPSVKEDTTLYGVRYDSTGKKFDAGFGYGCTHKYDLYDNAEDCGNLTHPCYDWWENLRELQEANENELV